MENKLLIINANTVFEKKDDKYFGYKSRFGDIVIGGVYSYRFVVHYAKTNQDVVIIPGDANTVTTPVCTTLEERLWKPGAQAKACRDEIIEQAKADIEKLANKYGYYYAYGRNTKAEFIVNCEKRTVVTILRWLAEGQIVAKGIAKAAPDDCYNVHIGRAIALRRALGLAVPDEYLNAPRPTEVRVGDFISDDSGVNKALVIEDDSWPPFSGGAVIYLKDARKYCYRIIDDSREER
ncbi:hypothetical protein [Bacillus inaquosorum]|uniref:hypothetical protein n=1 Tax=Bacillus inaquosorum TaxID=483913 RepID=UPI00227F2C45|nr:hypothetical protein [Bacillus inaquosorum]MCY8285226.1 hypothetical protein [Bacillus inaquosorum]MCY9456665.1 hypothetical protein [Bacillus inaquosorum]